MRRRTSVPPPRRPRARRRVGRARARREPLPGPAASPSRACGAAAARGCTWRRAFGGIAPDRRLERRACAVVGGDAAGDAATRRDEHAEQVSRLRCGGGEPLAATSASATSATERTRRPGLRRCRSRARSRTATTEGPHRAAQREVIVDRERPRAGSPGSERHARQPAAAGRRRSASRQASDVMRGGARARAAATSSDERGSARTSRPPAQPFGEHEEDREQAANSDADERCSASGVGRVPRRALAGQRALHDLPRAAAAARRSARPRARGSARRRGSGSRAAGRRARRSSGSRDRRRRRRGR